MRVLSLLAAAGIAAGAFEPFYIRIFTLDRSRVASMLTELPYKKLPGVRSFLLGVRARTEDGDAIALAATLHRGHWQGGYDYLYARSLYLLSGRHVLPLLDPADQPHPENLSQAKYIAAYRSDPQTPGFALVWRGDDGELLRRIK
jgi:hypothetical protein